MEYTYPLTLSNNTEYCFVIKTNDNMQGNTTLFMLNISWFENTNPKSWTISFFNTSDINEISKFIVEYITNKKYTDEDILTVVSLLYMLLGNNNEEQSTMYMNI